MTEQEARNSLLRAAVLVEHGNIVEAMRAVGMDFEWLEELTVDEAVGIFQVRVHDLTQLINRGDSE